MEIENYKNNKYRKKEIQKFKDKIKNRNEFYKKENVKERRKNYKNQ